MNLKSPCPHGRYDGHHTFDDKAISDLSVQEMATSNQRHRLGNCPGGTVLPPDSLVIVKEWTGYAEPQWPEWAVSMLGLYGPDGAPINVQEMFNALAAAQGGRET